MLSRFLATPLALASLALATLTLTGCPTNQSAVCQSVGDCSQGGSSDWVQNCQNEASLLQAEAQSDGCGPAYDDYYSCAASNFTCQGTTASFPGCETKLSALDTCINAAEAQTSCAQLTAAEATCGQGVVTADAGAADASSGDGASASDAGETEGGVSEGGADASPDSSATVDAAAPPQTPNGSGDAGPDAGPSVPIACSAARDCEARCYLGVVADVCAPQVDELDEFYTCASACPP